MNWVTRTKNIAWGMLAWLSFGFAVVFTMTVALIVPGAERRQKLATWACRMTFVLPMIDVRIRGIDNLPAGNCVVVANHASYLDGVLLKGYLPWRFSFVIKGEMRDFAPAHFLLRRAGAKFVERSDIKGSTRDARHIVRAAQAGESLAFFPEGTFLEEPGVGRFLPGAFVAAVKGEMPVVPIAISGSRYMLPANHFMPKRGPLTIDILPPIAPGDAEFASSRALAEAARLRILGVLDEPDLLDEKPARNA
ncbi:MAG: 1-acyl-sn-glycerol-3-phosphate acyltransferase [Gammaproteobacteria bacterium]|nr:1-acyl-sn-glycerol-3-phosphate acyltransferase [Gammaproteobacteria bacterium]